MKADSVRTDPTSNRARRNRAGFGRAQLAPGDLALAGGLLVVAVLSGLTIEPGRPGTIEPSAWWHWLLICMPPLLVVGRRAAPSPVAVAAGLAQVLVWINDLPEVLLPVIVVLYSAAAEDGRRGLRTAAGVGVVLTVVTAIGVRLAADVVLYQVPLVALTCGTAIALGVNADRRRREAATLATEAAETRLRAEHERDRAVADERAHIARELHDTIGHTLSVIAVRAEAADRVAAKRPEAAGEAVTAIADAARSALDDTRRVLRGLRRSSTVELAPSPDLTAVARLVDDLAAGGVEATLISDGCDRHHPPAAVAGGAHRIVQESLTNAVKHGGREVGIEVRMTCRSDALAIVVSNTVESNTVESSAVENGPPTGNAEGALGTGLTGMAERADVLGGRFRAGLDKSDVEHGDRFIVRAELPFAPTAGASAPERRP